METASLIDWIIRVSVFGLVLSLWSAGVLLYARRRSRRNRQVAERLGLLDGAPDADRVLHLWHDGRDATTIVHDHATGGGWVGRLDHVRRDAGLETAARSVLLAPVAVVGAVGVVTFMLVGTWIPSLIAMGAAAAACWSYLTFRIHRQSALFDGQLIEALELASRSLRAGHPVLAAFRVAADETPPPVGRVFAEICQQQELGASQEDALRSLGAEVRDRILVLKRTDVCLEHEIELTRFRQCTCFSRERRRYFLRYLLKICYWYVSDYERTFFTTRPSCTSAKQIRLVFPLADIPKLPRFD